MFFIPSYPFPWDLRTVFFSGLAPHPPQLVQRAYRSNGIGNGCSKSVTVISSISHNRNYLWLPKCWTSAPPWASPYPARLSEIGPQVSLSHSPQNRRTLKELFPGGPWETAVDILKTSETQTETKTQKKKKKKNVVTVFWGFGGTKSRLRREFLTSRCEGGDDAWRG